MRMKMEKKLNAFRKFSSFKLLTITNRRSCTSLYRGSVVKGFCVTRDVPKISSATRKGAKISLMRDWTSRDA